MSEHRTQHDEDTVGTHDAVADDDAAAVAPSSRPEQSAPSDSEALESQAEPQPPAVSESDAGSESDDDSQSDDDGTDHVPAGRPISFDPMGETQVMMQPVAPAPAPTVTAQVLPPALPETVTCPECGTVGSVVLSRRDSADFCTNCDYPLFWTPSKIQLDRANLSDDSLRRLPGTVGRVAVASFPCPHCAELNAVSAVDCIRCGRPLHPVRVRREPVPVYVPPAPPPVEPEPEKGTPWWVWLLVGLSIAAAITLIVLFATNTIG
jgi:hypothetical protein